jgi:hypothetical protein
MFWVNPAALFTLAAIAAPVLIHILIQRRAERFPFPTLRFLQPTRLASIRRHVLDDPALLVVRAGVLGAAALALAGPLLVNSSRRHAWDSRVVRAIVADSDSPAAASVPDRDSQGVVAMQRQFNGRSLADGIRRAVLWLETTPPARREIVVVSPLPIGSIAQADISAVPGDIGIRFEKMPTLPSERTAAGGRLLTADRVRAREVTLNGERTSFRDVDVDAVAVWPIDVVAPEQDRRVVEAAIAAVRSRGVRAAPPDRRARVVLAAPADGTSDAAPTDRTLEALPVQRPWMAQAIARMTRDPDLRAAGTRAAAGLADPRFAGPPWQTLAAAADGRPLAAAAESTDRLLIESAAEASSLATPVLLRSIANAMAPASDLQHAEVVPVADAVLGQWSRPPAPVVSPRIDTVGADDRCWFWLVALCLLALETWMGRGRPASASERRAGERSRVA